MPKKNKTYQYLATDNPVDLAKRFNLTAPEIIKANPGGYPFETGQTINLPYETEEYGTLFAETPGTAGATGNVSLKPTPYYPYQGAQYPAVPLVNAPQGYWNDKRVGSPTYTRPNYPGGTTDDSWYVPEQPATINPAFGGFTNTGGPQNTDYANTAAAQYYAANNTPFLQQKRYDPSTGKYETLGKLLRQGKLDIKTGKFNPRGRRRKSGNNRQLAQEQQETDMTVANTLVSFGASAG